MTARPAFAPELAALLLAAFVLRFGVFYLVPNVHWPDEIYQVMEPAHRLVFGNGILSWEWVVGIRSWLLPGIAAALMELGRNLGDSPTDVNLPVEIALALAGIVPVACAYGWGRRFEGRVGGFIAGGVTAIWVDLVYMSGHPLTEVVAADCLPAALYLGLPAGGVTRSRPRLFGAGILLGLTFALRFHLAPGLAVAALGICGVRNSGPRWRALIAGAAVPVLVLGVLDWVTLGTPFQSVWLNIWVNIGLGVSSEAGREPFLTLWTLPLEIWGVAGFAIVLITAIQGARRLPVPIYVAAAIVAFHSLIPHKEYRFSYPALPLLIILSGLGTAELVRAAVPHLPRPGAAAPLLAALTLLLWSGLSYTIADSAIFKIPWTRERAQIAAFDAVTHRADACGLGLLGLRWVVTPGMSALPRGVALDQLRAVPSPGGDAAYNYVLATIQAPTLPDSYRRVDCFAGDRDAAGLAHIRLCLWRRAGGCTAPAPPVPVNWPRTLAGNRADSDSVLLWKNDPDDR